MNTYQTRILSTALALALGASSWIRAGEVGSSSRYVNVKDMGAKGDGASDDTEAIQKALDHLSGVGGTVFIPEGNYRITKTLYTTGSHATVREPLDYIEIRGAGKNATRLLGDGVDYILSGSAEKDAKEKRRITHGMTLTGVTFSSFNTASAARCGGVNVSYMIRWSVNSCQFVALKTGIFSYGRDEMKDEEPDSLAVYIIRIENSIFYGCSDFAIKLGRIFDCSIENNEIEHGVGGIQVGTPGDGFDAAANNLRIVNNVIEGLGPGAPAILGSCWIGSQIVGNYFEANAGGDVVLTPKGRDGWLRGITIVANTFQPTKAFRDSKAYGPLLLAKTIDTVITGNFSTTSHLIHPRSENLRKGVNIASNVLRNPASIGDIHGAKAGNSSDYLAESVSEDNAEQWSVSSTVATVGIHSLLGFRYAKKDDSPRSVIFGSNHPTDVSLAHSPGDLVLNQSPTITADKKILVGWICMTEGKPGTWKPLLMDTE